MRLEILRDKMKIYPENLQDVAFIEDTLGITYRNNIGQIFFLRNGSFGNDLLCLEIPSNKGIGEAKK